MIDDNQFQTIQNKKLRVYCVNHFVTGITIEIFASRDTAEKWKEDHKAIGVYIKEMEVNMEIPKN